MDTLQLIASATGIGFLAGIRLYLTVLTLGLAVRFEWLRLSDHFSELSILGNWWVIGFAAAAALVEFFSDKIPWLDSAWDSIHTFIRPVGAAALSVAAFDSVDPALRFLLVLVTGGAALTSHSAKAATRLAVNQSPEPFSNVALSLVGDAAVPVGIWLAFEHPLLIGGVAALFILVALILAPKVFRVVRIHWLALSALLTTWLNPGDDVKNPFSGDPAALAADPKRLATAFSGVASSLPEACVAHLRNKHGVDSAFALHGVMRRGGKRIRNRDGYLCLLDDRFVFVAKKLGGWRGEELPHASLKRIDFEKGLLFDSLRLRGENTEVLVDLFKDHRRGAQRLAEVWNVAR
ncbi:MAG: DUF4126 domain-containing protein [Bryobacterales bacterium]|nr:DUF4126 domain-containing protein [Bryobacterales bacterium]